LVVFGIAGSARACSQGWEIECWRN
jgi:hypothetical protein